MIEGTEKDPQFELRDMPIEYLVYELVCDCGEKGGDITFEASKVSDEAELEAHLDANHDHTCHVCCCKDRNNPSHANYGGACKVNIHA